MTCLSGTPAVPASRRVWIVRYQRVTRGITPILAPLLIALVGCRDDAESPTAPDAQAALATGSAPARSYYQVSGGYDHSCGVTTDEVTFCWGSGFLGDGQEYLRVPPQLVAGGHQFRQVSSGGDQNCAVTTDNRAYCWGRNGYGQLGDGTTTDRSTPVLVGSGREFRQLDMSTFHACGIGYADGRVYCWGRNSEGQLGDGSTTQRFTPVPVAGARKFRQVRVGWTHTCGLTTSGEAFCWGSNIDGQIGDGSTAKRRLRPARVAGGLIFRQLDVGFSHVCGVTTNNRAFCWGNGGAGQIGDGKTNLRFTPRAVTGGLSFDRVSTGYNHTCGETTDNRAYCWGENENGQLGDGTTTPRSRPVAVGGGLTFTQVSAGDFHTCGIASGSATYCWGWNWGGQLGDLTITDRSTPVPVTGES